MPNGGLISRTRIKASCPRDPACRLRTRETSSVAFYDGCLATATLTSSCHALNSAGGSARPPQETCCPALALSPAPALVLSRRSCRLSVEAARTSAGRLSAVVLESRDGRSRQRFPAAPAGRSGGECHRRAGDGPAHLPRAARPRRAHRRGPQRHE